MGNDTQLKISAAAQERGFFPHRARVDSGRRQMPHTGEKAGWADEPSPGITNPAAAE
jgi:hypothetical protein